MIAPQGELLDPQRAAVRMREKKARMFSSGSLAAPPEKLEGPSAPTPPPGIEPSALAFARQLVAAGTAASESEIPAASSFADPTTTSNPSNTSGENADLDAARARPPLDVDSIALAILRRLGHEPPAYAQ